MGKVILRYFFVLAFLIFVSDVFAYGLVDVYNFLTALGWSRADAVGFLGVSMLASAKLNPTIGASVIAGALTGYIIANGVKLVDALVEYMNIRKGVAVVLPLNYQGDGGTVLVGPGQAAWQWIYVAFDYYSGFCDFAFECREGYNSGGNIIVERYFFSRSGISYGSMGSIMDRVRSELRGKMRSAETIAVCDALLNMAQGWWLSKTDYSIFTISRSLVAAPTGVSEVINSATYTPVNKPVLTPGEADVGYSLLSNPSAFLDWARSMFGEDGIFEGNVGRDAINSILNDIKAYLEDLGVQNVDIYNKITEIYDRWNNVTNVENVTNEINTKVDNVTNAINELKQMVQELQGQSGTVDFSEVIGRIDALESAIEAKVQAVSDTLGSMEQSIEEGKGVLQGIKEWLDKFWDDLFTKWREFLSGEWFLEWVKWLYHMLVIPEDYQQVWSDVVSGWKESVRFEVDIGSKLNVSGDSISDFSIPLGSWSIPVHVNSYIEMLGLREVITTIVIASMWLGVLFGIIPRFVI